MVAPVREHGSLPPHPASNSKQLDLRKRVPSLWIRGPEALYGKLLARYVLPESYNYLSSSSLAPGNPLNLPDLFNTINAPGRIANSLLDPDVDTALLMAVGVDRTVAKFSRIDQEFSSHIGSEAMSKSLSMAPSAGYPAVTDHRHPSAPRPVDCERPDHELEIQIHTGSPSLLDRKRRSSKTKEIRRSSSTPHMRNLAINNAGELSPTTDKRRNKLGYHRISVACG